MPIGADVQPEMAVERGFQRAHRAGAWTAFGVDHGQHGAVEAIQERRKALDQWGHGNLPILIWAALQWLCPAAAQGGRVRAAAVW